MHCGRALGFMCLLSSSSKAGTIPQQQHAAVPVAAQSNAHSSFVDVWSERHLASPDGVCSHCSCSMCVDERTATGTPSSMYSSLDWELDVGDEQSPCDGKGPDAATQQGAVLPRVQQRRVQAPPCLQVPRLIHTDCCVSAGSAALMAFGPLSDPCTQVDCSSCSPDVHRGSAGKDSSNHRRHSHASGLVPEQQQQQGCKWECDLETACPRTHSSPVPSLLLAPVHGQKAVQRRSAPPALKSLAPFVAAAISGHPPQKQVQQFQSSAIDGDAATWAERRPASTGAVPPCTPRAMCSPKPTQLLVVSPNIPAEMQRRHWCLAEFWISQRLYKGYASSVYHAIDRQTNNHVALKVYHTGRLHELNRYQVLREVQLHSQLQHPNIIQMYAAFQEEEDIVMVLEYAGGGDLYGLLRKAGGRLTEQQAVNLVLQPFLSALAYIHTKGIVHRDIKPENVLLSSDSTLKVADFGLAIDLNQERAVTRAGTLDYMAPEALRCPVKEHPLDFKQCRMLQYNTSVDVWAVGVLTYELLVGFPPFASNSPGDAVHKILACDVVFPRRISAGAREFVQEALRRHPGDRPTIAEMCAGLWINGGQRAPEASEAVISPNPQAMQSGPGFGEAALLRCLMAVQPPHGSKPSSVCSSLPSTVPRAAATMAVHAACCEAKGTGVSSCASCLLPSAVSMVPSAGLTLPMVAPALASPVAVLHHAAAATPTAYSRTYLQHCSHVVATNIPAMSEVLASNAAERQLLQPALACNALWPLQPVA